MTENNALTLAQRTLGATMTSPQERRVPTEMMPGHPQLLPARQREVR